MQEFAVGQRWLSDTESELGLGVVIAVEDRTVSILFPMSDETRVYSRRNAPLSRIILSVGHRLTDLDDVVWQIDRVEAIGGQEAPGRAIAQYHCQRCCPVSGEVIHKVLAETRLAAHLQLARPLERLLSGQLDNREWFDLRIEALMLHGQLQSSRLRGLLGPRVGLIPHQLYIAHEVGKRLAPRVLLADEVGLGKTIEAGLIIYQQYVTGRSERVLVLVPDSLQHQWMIELRRRFNLNFSVFNLERTASIREHDPEQNPFLTEQCIIASIDFLLDHPDLQEQALLAGFDLLVVDEAHHLAWEPAETDEDGEVLGGGNDRYDLVELFAEQTPGLLLLTATPEQLGVASHFARLRLLDPARFDDLDAFVAQEQDYQAVAQLADALLTDEPLPPALRQLSERILGACPDDDEASRQQALDRLLDQHGVGRVLFRNTREAVPGFMGRDCLPAPLPAPADWPLTGNLRQQMWPEETRQDEDWLDIDPRVAWLTDLLKTTLKSRKVLLIARSGLVAELLDGVLQAHGLRTAQFHEAMSLLERDQAAAFFANESYGAQVLLCSEIGSEGRNFQFAHHLVLWDLPSNPDVLEQRIGRLDRIGQRQRIQIHVPYLMGTAQERMFRWYHEALDIFGHISPTAQVLQDEHIVALKAALLTDQGEPFEQLLEQVNAQRLALETTLQQGRDRLLEYNSCRPQVAQEIVDALSRHDTDSRLPDFLLRFMSATNIDYDEQSDGSVVVRPSDQMQVEGLDLPEAGLTMTFSREQALIHDHLAYMTEEHPLVDSLFELVRTQRFGNTSVVALRSNALAAGTLLIEAWFRPEVIAPRMLNLAASLPQPLIRVLLGEKGQDLSERLGASALQPYLQRLDVSTGRQVVKLRRDDIARCYQKAEQLAQQRLSQIATQAQAHFAARYDQEVQRLEYLRAQGGSVRADEISRLQQVQTLGVERLGHLALVPDAVRVMVAVKA